MPLRVAIIPSSNYVAKNGFERSVQGCNPAHWGYEPDQKTLYDRLNIGDFAIFPYNVGFIKWIGQVIARYTDHNMVTHTCPVTGKTGLVTKTHSLYWIVDPEQPNRTGKHIIVMRPLDNRLHKDDYRDYILTANGMPWDKTNPQVAPHRSNKVLDEDRTPDLINELRQLAIK
jgi:hypothetical protein